MPGLFLRLVTESQLPGGLQGREAAEHRENLAGQSFAESVHPSASESADVSGADRIALGHRRWHRAHSRPVLSGLMQFALLCPQKRVEGKGAEEQGGRAPGKRVRGKRASPQPAADPAWHHCCGPRAPTWRARWGQQEQVQLRGRETPAPPPWTQPSPATLLLNTGRNLVPSTWLSFSSLLALSSLSPPPPHACFPCHHRKSHHWCPHSVQQPWTSPQVQLNFCWPSHEEESRELK